APGSAKAARSAISLVEELFVEALEPVKRQGVRMRVVVIGAGAMGLAAAYRAAKNGHQVDLIEAAPEPGGMAGHFDFDGVSIERFYHFICHTDDPTFGLMKELGIADKLRWRPTSMGFFDGKLHAWGDPFALLRYP